MTKPGWGYFNSSAQLCPAGSYSAGGTREPCTPCGAGWTTAAAGAASRLSCGESNTGSSSCHGCCSQDSAVLLSLQHTQLQVPSLSSSFQNPAGLRLRQRANKLPDFRACVLSLTQSAPMCSLLFLPAILGADISPGFYSASSVPVPCAKGSYKEGIGFAAGCQPCSQGVTTANMAADTVSLCLGESCCGCVRLTLQWVGRPLPASTGYAMTRHERLAAPKHFWVTSIPQHQQRGASHIRMNAGSCGCETASSSHLC